MRANTKQALRWLAVAAFGGFAAWESVTGLLYTLSHSGGSWLGSVWPLGLLAFITAPFYAVAYLCFRRQYRRLFHVLGVVSAVLVFGVLTSLPLHLHLFESLERHLRTTPWHLVVALPVALVCLSGPVYAAVWVLRICRRMAYPPVRENLHEPCQEHTG